MVENVKTGSAVGDTTAGAGHRRAERRRAQRRSLIIAACEEQLAETGLAGTTLASVGDRVGLSKAALYYYVDGRDELLALVLDDALRAIRADAAAAVTADASPVDELRAFANAHVLAAVERPAGPMIISNVDYLAAHDRTAELLHDHELHARAIIERGVVAGLLRPVPPVVASTAFFGALNTLCRAYDPDGSLALGEMIDATLDLLLGGWADPTGAG
ncbi:MAG: TetR/AcrR family transcriptional regulator [Actinomycetota bacterium]